MRRRRVRPTVVDGSAAWVRGVGAEQSETADERGERSRGVASERPVTAPERPEGQKLPGDAAVRTRCRLRGAQRLCSGRLSDPTGESLNQVGPRR